jgi:hypothetical protein
MHADDECDPLDRWLSQQVQPLPPPPGTFELITRRSRRRKLRKLAVTVVSAAAVAAAVAIAVPVGLNLHLSQSPTKGNYAAGGASPTHSTNTQSPNGNGSQVKTSSPSPTATQPTIAPSAQAHPVPRNFQPTSVTFVNSDRAWVIGQAGTPGTCDNNDPYICTSIARTDDDGQSWQGAHAPDTGAPSGKTGVGGIRFLNGSYGWAFGPELWATSDGGNTWSQVDTGGARVTDLETSDGRAYALWATCSGSSSAGFAADCTSYTLMTATAGSGDWKAVGGLTNGLTDGGGATSAVLALTGSDGYLLAPDGTLYSGPIGGTWTRAGTAPCQPGEPPQANGLPAGAVLALVDSTQLAIACNAISSTSAPLVYTSDDSGATWKQLPAGSWSGIPDLNGLGTMTSLAATPNDTTITLATTTGIYVLSGGVWKPSNATGSGAPAGGFTYVGMTTDDQGVAVPADTSLHEIWMTTDAGASWASATSITPGK